MNNLNLINDVPVTITVVLGRKQLTISELLTMGRGAVVELDSKVGDPVDIMVNNVLVARGELIISDEKLGITLTELKVNK